MRKRIKHQEQGGIKISQSHLKDPSNRCNSYHPTRKSVKSIYLYGAFQTQCASQQQKQDVAQPHTGNTMKIRLKHENTKGRQCRKLKAI